jgi:DNA-directed RNA polymerase subunit RPC12/RpoP
MIETTIYKCEYCGAEFDDESGAHCHEWICRYKDVRKQDGSRLEFYKEDGSKIKFDDASFVRDDFDDVVAFTVNHECDIQFVVDFFEWYGFENPFRQIEVKDYEYMYIDDVWKLLGLWWFDPDHRYGEWVRVNDQIEKWTDIKNKFEKDA